MATAAESDAVRSGATDKTLDTAGVRRLETLWAGRILSNLFVVRLVRNAATACDDQLDLGPNSPRQNDADLTPDALKGCWQPAFTCRKSVFRFGEIGLAL